MLKIAFKNKYLIIVLSLLIAIINIVVLKKLPVDILPNYKTSAVQVLTLYPGMPAEVMEKDITSRIERWTGQSNGIARQESKSMIGVSIVKDFFTEDIDPNTALSQVTSLAMSDLFYLPPGTIPPMVMPFDPTASVPLALLAVSSDSLSEKGLYDIAYFQLRNLLGSVPGVIAPAVYGGKLRRIYMYVYPDKLQAYNLTQTDVVNAVQKNNVMIPTGDVNIGNMNYSVNVNGMLPKVDDFNNIVIKMSKDGSPIFLKDIGYAKDASAIQTNVVHINGKRQVYIPIYKRTGGNTIAAVEGIKGKLAELKERLPKSVNLDVVLDQSTYVRNSINGLMKEGITGLVLVSLALFLFLGNFRSTFIVALSIPLSVMFAFIGLYFTGDTINSMTLGGIALAIGLLVDDSIVVIENIDKHLKLGKTSTQAAFDGTKEVAMPVLITTLTIIIVFFPIIFLTGISKYLFTPLAVVVSLAMIGSRFFSMTLVPIMAASLFKNRDTNGNHQTKSFTGRFEKGVTSLTHRYVKSIDKVLQFRWWLLGGVALLFVISMFGFSRLGTELFPRMDVGQISIDVRMESGTAISQTEKTVTAIENYLKQQIGTDEKIIISNIGVLNDWPAAYTPNSGTQDATISIQLTEGHKTKTADYVKKLRVNLKEQFPGVQFIFNTGGIITTALNFGLPSPIDIQITGNDLQKSHDIAVKVRDAVQNIKGTEDVRIQQRYDHPEIKLDIDRTKAAELGISAEDVVKNTVSALNSSVNFKPSFWIDEKNGNHYFVGVTYPEADLDNPQSIENISLNGDSGKVTLLRNIAKTSLSSAPIEINHLNIQRVTDVFSNVEGRDIGSVASEIKSKLADIRKNLPEGYTIASRGEVQSMDEGFSNLGLGLVLAILLVYLVIVPLLRSFKLPLIIITVIPLGLIGVTAILLATNTYLNIQSMMGIIMMVGITVAYSNLLVDKMNNLLKEGKPLEAAIKEGVANRFRPIMMTSVVTVLALMPMAIGYETGGEANVPLARAIIGGVLAASFLSLFVVPVLFYLFNQKSQRKMKLNNINSIFIPLAAILLLSSCGNNTENNKKTEVRNIPVVMVANPETHLFDANLQISGTAEPNQQVKLYAMTDGFIKQLKVDIGSFVKEGQTLAVLQNPDLYSQKAKLEALLKEKKILYNRYSASPFSTPTGADMVGKKSIYERLKSIYEKTPQLTTIADVEKAKADYESAKALLTIETAKAEADFQSLAAQLHAINLQISYLTVRAPFTGVIVNRLADKGAIIQNGLNNANAMPLFELQDLKPIRLKLDVPESDATMIEKNTKTTITFPEMVNGNYKATVTRIAYGLSDATKTMKVEIDLPNKDLKIRPGMYAKVEIQLSGHKDVPSVPNEAIGNINGQSFIYVIKNNKARKVDVKTGIKDAKYTELLNAAIKPNDEVVVKGKEFCSDGATVQTKTLTN
ncbi:MAG: efflux RND transporter periplasmic adaptor subunit [Bacteroidota bacterium]|nr:efflux RND transporter periplasmic adaptor subunit [Bacteroidota bacterium]